MFITYNCPEVEYYTILEDYNIQMIMNMMMDFSTYSYSSDGFPSSIHSMTVYIWGGSEKMDPQSSPWLNRYFNGLD